MENLNAEQIKKALECCHKESIVLCRECPYTKEYNEFCANKLMKDALALINSQEQKIKELTEDIKWSAERIIETDKKVLQLNKENGHLRDRLIGKIELDIAEVRADTVQEMLQRIKEDAVSVSLLSNPPKFMLEIREDALDQIAKEMLEGKNEN